MPGFARAACLAGLLLILPWLGEGLVGLGLALLALGLALAYEPTPAEFDLFRKAGQPPALALVRREVGDEWIDSALKAVADAEKSLRSY